VHAYGERRKKSVAFIAGGGLVPGMYIAIQLLTPPPFQRLVAGR
jgi:hypothetical protein